ncbi:MAG: hypothetical protein Q8Q54_09805, partial [Methylococcales bacterium]|nr:hypothetical protein [Methylococcales bacterium]
MKIVNLIKSGYMNKQLKSCGKQLAKWTSVVVLVTGLNGCAAIAGLNAAMSIYDMLGGSSVLSGLANTILTSSMSDPRLSGMLSTINPDTATPQITNQLCSLLGGNCIAPFTQQQVAEGSARLTPEQQSAVSDNLGNALNAVTSNTMVRNAVVN